MTLLAEVSGASERPGGSHIQVEQSENGVVTVWIPARSLPFLVGAGAVVLAFNLLVVLYLGVMLFVLHRSVGVMSEIAPRDLPVTLRHWSVPLVLGWVGLEALGVASLVALVRPGFVRERLTFLSDRLEWRSQGWGRERVRTLRHAEVRGFEWKRDPVGIEAGSLFLLGRGDRLEIAENVSEAEREWLCSVGNTLLRKREMR